jgi:hypothetical protein
VWSRSKCTGALEVDWYSVSSPGSTDLFVVFFGHLNCQWLGHFRACEFLDRASLHYSPKTYARARQAVFRPDPCRDSVVRGGLTRG